MGNVRRLRGQESRRRNILSWVQNLVARFSMIFRRQEKAVEVKQDIKPRYEDQLVQDPKEDQFGFRDYADVLVKRVLEATPPMVVGVFGSWGSGQTSLMHMLEAGVTAAGGEKIKPIWLNIWELSNHEEVWHAFLQALFSK